MRKKIDVKMFSGQLKKLEESMAADEEEIEKLRGEEKERLKVCISKPLLVLILYSVLRDTGLCLTWVVSSNILLVSANNQAIFI